MRVLSLNTSSMERAIFNRIMVQADAVAVSLLGVFSYQRGQSFYSESMTLF